MCKSNKCQGTCKSMMNNDSINPKESIHKIIDGLETLTNCSVVKPAADTVSHNYITRMNNLKEEAHQLQSEINSYNTDADNKAETPAESHLAGNSKDENSFMEKVNLLKKKIQLIEESLSAIL